MLASCGDYILDLPNQAPIVSMPTDTYCSLDERIIFTFTFSDYEERPLDFEIITEQKVLDIANTHSSSRGAQSSQQGYTHYVAWQKACDVLDFTFDDYQAPEWVTECPPTCALRPDPKLNTDIDTCFSLPDEIPMALDIRVLVSDGESQSEASFNLSYSGPCTDL